MQTRFGRLKTIRISQGADKMIVTENYAIRADGVLLVRTYSSLGRKIMRDGEAYDEAIDPLDAERTYTEADTPTELSAEEALEILIGGSK